MSPQDLIKTIYLGDRICLGLILDGSKGRISIEVDCISRVRSASGTWDFYCDEDIERARLVFEDARWFSMDPPGFIPNEYINGFEIVAGGNPTPDTNNRLVFRLLIASVNEEGIPTQVTVEIHAAGFYLEDPANPGIEIRE